MTEMEECLLPVREAKSEFESGVGLRSRRLGVRVIVAALAGEERERRVRGRKVNAIAYRKPFFCTRDACAQLVGVLI